MRTTDSIRRLGKSACCSVCWVVLVGLAAAACTSDPPPPAAGGDVVDAADSAALAPGTDVAAEAGDSGTPADADTQVGCQTDDQCKDFTAITAQCQKAVCNKTTGVCQLGLADDGATCDDGKACTAGDKCSKNGICSGQVACTTLIPGTSTVNPCKVGSCGDGGKCEFVNKTGVTCDDNNPCTSGEVCVAGGKCGTGQPKFCQDDGISCTVEVCDSKTGDCSTYLQDDGAACDPKDLCIGEATCAKGDCKGTAVKCKTPTNPCTSVYCDPLKGCVEKALGDGTVCGPGRACIAGKCYP